MYALSYTDTKPIVGSGHCACTRFHCISSDPVHKQTGPEIALWLSRSKGLADTHRIALWVNISYTSAMFQSESTLQMPLLSNGP